MKATLRLVLVLCLAACGGADEPVEHPAPMPGEAPFEYPVALWDEGLEGETLLMVHVTELGQVDSAYVLEGSGFLAFDSAAVAGARRLRFSPARQGARRVPMWTKVPVRFARDTADARPEGGLDGAGR